MNIDLQNKKRILILGNGGSGKSTFARLLSDKLNLDVFHLDKLFWKPGWQKPDTYEFRKIVSSLANKDEWIIDGTYRRTLYSRVERADLIYLFDYSVYFSLFRIYKRSIKSKIKRTIGLALTAAELAHYAKGCKEKMPDWDFIRFVLRYKKDVSPEIFLILNKLNFNMDNLIIFKNRKEFEDHKTKWEKK